MRKKRGSRPQRAFTLVELIIAIALFAIIIVGISGIFTMSMRNRTATIGGLVLQSNTDMAGQCLRQALAQATYIQLPSAPFPSTAQSLVTWSNTSPDGTSAPPYQRMFTGAPTQYRTFNAFCIDSTNSLYLYTNGGGCGQPCLSSGCDVTPPISTAYSCGGAGPAGTVTKFLVAGGAGSSSIVVNTSFTRPSNNVVQLGYAVGLAQPDAQLQNCSLLPRSNPSYANVTACIEDLTQIDLLGSLN